MTYNYNTPLPNDLPSDNQIVFLNNFDSLNEQFSLNHVPLGRIVEGATLSNPCQISSTKHGLTTGDTVIFTHVQGIDEQGYVSPWVINGGGGYVVTVVNENVFEIPVDSTTFNPYVPNVGDFSSTSYNYGYHTQLFFPPSAQNFKQPDLQSPSTSLYSKTIGDFSSLFFQKGPQAVLECLLTLFPFSATNIDYIETVNGIGFTTPWGLIFNIGTISKKTKQTATPIVFDLPKPFSTVAYTGILQQIGKAPPIKGSFSFPSLTTGSIKISTANLTTSFTFSYYYIAIGK